jgi:hypothetical protein
MILGPLEESAVSRGSSYKVFPNLLLLSLNLALLGKRVRGQHATYKRLTSTSVLSFFTIVL